jgi:phage replication-related protein YjqB (UPF0714/DUF867 family)
MRVIIFKRPFTAHRIAAGRFDENDFGTEVGKQQTAVTAHSSGRIQDPQTA